MRVSGIEPWQLDLYQSCTIFVPNGTKKGKCYEELCGAAELKKYRKTGISRERKIFVKRYCDNLDDEVTG